MKKITKEIEVLLKKINLKDVIIYLGLAILVLAIYLPFSINELTNPDGILNSTSYIYDTSGAWEMTLGRFGIMLINKLKLGVVSPNLMALMYAVVLPIISFIICEILRLKKYLIRFLVGLLVIFSPNTINTFVLYYTADAYLISYFLTVFSVYIADKYKKSYFIPIICIFMSLHLFQGYISVTIMLCLLVILKNILIDEIDAKKILSKILKFILIGISAVVLYLVSVKILQNILEIDMLEVEGYNMMGKIDLFNMPQLIKSSYYNFYQYFFGENFLNNSWGARNVINWIMFLLIFIMIRNKY